MLVYSPFLSHRGSGQVLPAPKDGDNLVKPDAELLFKCLRIYYYAIATGRLQDRRKERKDSDESDASDIEQQQLSWKSRRESEG